MDRSLPEYSREEVITEIRARSPWYQRISFPTYGLTTTDDPAWGVKDPAYDNLFPGVPQEFAFVYRPEPKYERIAPFLPDMTGASILDVGSSCGYFSFKFAERGARCVTGLELDGQNVERAEFCARLLGHTNVSFVQGDIGDYSNAHDIVWGSSVHEHFFFPFYYLTRLLCLARKLLVLETHHYKRDDSHAVAKLDLSDTLPADVGCHAFHFSRRMYSEYLRMLGISLAEQTETAFYEDETVRRVLLFVRTEEFQRNRGAHSFLQPLRTIG